MTTAAGRQAAYAWIPDESARRASGARRILSDEVYWERNETKPRHNQLNGPAPLWAEDLLTVARAVFAADRYTRRDEFFDRWTRRISLSVPVSAPDRWEAALAHLIPLLNTTTGDLWQIEFTVRRDMYVQDSLPGGIASIGEVSLFSGGLDSLAWTAQRAAVRPNGALLLVTFREPGLLGKVQREVYKQVHQHGDRNARQLVYSQEVRGPKDRTLKLERSTRSRGLLYAATGVRVAAAENIGVLHIPENGQVAVNPPLSASRSGACSTRSVHPWTLYHLNQLIIAIGGTVKVHNPLAALTKGEVCCMAKTAKIPEDIVTSTLSCGSSPVRQRNQPNVPNCGSCFPCLIRRAGLLHAFKRDRTRYATAPWDAALPPDWTVHWRAVKGWLQKEFTPLDLLADTPLPPHQQPEDLLPVIRKGREELQALVDAAPDRGRSAPAR
ncbi:hypothetical protein [Streptomyces sp. NPDC050560]|uniref:hypothetical protein n=1 Tax=Streptomyces sp. NPDC050560 TaxID=3365630 RepID=UPI0037978C32